MATCTGSAVAFDYQLLKVITREQLAALQRRYSGHLLYMPEVMPPGHPIACLIGYEAAISCSARFGGLYFYITRSLLIRQRNERVRWARAHGADSQTVAQVTGISQRTVRRICEGEALANNNKPFGLRRRRLQAELQGLKQNDGHTRRYRQGARAPGRG